jgi:hypothetical protein
MDRKTDRWIERHRDRYKDRQVDRKTDVQVYDSALVGMTDGQHKQIYIDID